MGYNNEKSRYTLVVDNISSLTRSKDLRKEMEYFGPVYEVEIDRRTRCGLVEFRRSGDASEAWSKMDRFMMDGRRWKVDWATRQDFKLFKWKWTESSSGRSPSRSPSPSPSRGRSRSRSADKGSPGTPSNKNSD